MCAECKRTLTHNLIVGSHDDIHVLTAAKQLTIASGSPSIGLNNYSLSTIVTIVSFHWPKLVHRLPSQGICV